MPPMRPAFSSPPNNSPEIDTPNDWIEMIGNFPCAKRDGLMRTPSIEPLNSRPPTDGRPLTLAETMVVVGDPAPGCGGLARQPVGPPEGRPRGPADAQDHAERLRGVQLTGRRRHEAAHEVPPGREPEVARLAGDLQAADLDDGADGA